MNTYILIMTVTLFQATGNAIEIEVAEFDNQVSCLEGGFKWSEKFENTDTSGAINAFFVCAEK